MKRLGPWIAVALPAFSALAWVLAFRADVPEPAAWRSELGEPELRFSYETWREFEGELNLIGFRILNVASIDRDSGRFGTLTLLGWILALVTVVALVRIVLGGSTVPGHPWAESLIALALSAWFFSPAHGTSWLLGERFRLFAFTASAALAALLLVGQRAWRLRFGTALLVALSALLFDRSGFVVWVALVPLVVTAARTQRGGIWGPIAVWAFFGNLATVLVHEGANAGDWSRAGGGLSDAMLRIPFALAPATYGADPEVAAAWIGPGAVAVLAVVAISAVCRRAGKDDHLRSAALFSVVIAGVLAAAHDGLLQEVFGWSEAAGRDLRVPSLLGGCGLLGLATTTMQRAGGLFKGLAIAVALTAALASWIFGVSHLQESIRVLDAATATVQVERLGIARMPDALQVFLRPDLVSAKIAKGRATALDAPRELRNAVSSGANAAPVIPMAWSFKDGSAEGPRPGEPSLSGAEMLILIGQRADAQWEVAAFMALPSETTGRNSPWRMKLAEPAGNDLQRIRLLTWRSRDARLARAGADLALRDGAFQEEAQAPR